MKVFEHRKGSIRGIAFATLMRALMDGEHTRKELSDITGLHVETISNYIHWMHRKRVVVISNWTKQAVHGDPVPHFSLNVDDDEDAPRPEPKSRQQIDMEYRKRQEAKQLNRLFAGGTDERVS